MFKIGDKVTYKNSNALPENEAHGIIVKIVSETEVGVNWGCGVAWTLQGHPWDDATMWVVTPSNLLTIEE